MEGNNTITPTEADTPPTPWHYRIPTVMHLLDVSWAMIYRMVAREDLELVKLSPRACRITSESVERASSGRRGQE